MDVVVGKRQSMGQKKTLRLEVKVLEMEIKKEEKGSRNHWTGWKKGTGGRENCEARNKEWTVES
jgi:hypothetical protein